MESIFMVKLNDKNRTAPGSAKLCERCAWGQCITGYRQSERMVICTNTAPNLAVPFPVLACTSFSDRERPSWGQMQKLALDVKKVRMPSRNAGFGVVAIATELETDKPASKAVAIR